MQQQHLRDRAAGSDPTAQDPSASGRQPPAQRGPDAPAQGSYTGASASHRARPPHRPRRQHRASAPPPALVHRHTHTVLLAACASTAAVTVFDVVLTERLSMFFDLCFVLVGLSAALVVKRAGFFAVGVLPPLLLGAVVAVLTVVDPSTLTASHLAFVSTWLTGLAHHGTALVATHVVVLTILGLRLPQTAR